MPWNNAVLHSDKREQILVSVSIILKMICKLTKTNLSVYLDPGSTQERSNFFEFIDLARYSQYCLLLKVVLFLFLEKYREENCPLQDRKLDANKTNL